MRQVGVVEDTPHGDRETMFASRAAAQVADLAGLPWGFGPEGLGAVALWADNALRPADALEVVDALLFSSEPAAVALVIVGHRLAASLLERQAGLGAIEGLDLGFLIERENQSMRGRVQIESDDVVEFLGETRVVAELEGLDAMGLEAKGVPRWRR